MVLEHRTQPVRQYLDPLGPGEGVIHSAIDLGQHPVDEEVMKLLLAAHVAVQRRGNHARRVASARMLNASTPSAAMVLRASVTTRSRVRVRRRSSFPVGGVNHSGRESASTVVSGRSPSGAGVTPTGTTNVLVMLVDWTSPDSVTPASATTQMFTDTNGYYRDASFGGLGQTGAVTPWLKIAGPSIDANGNPRCYGDFGTIMNQARSAATAAGYTMDSYSNYVVYFPRCAGDSAGYSGWAYVGSTDTWLNGYLDRRVTVHEQGHNYGLWHSHSYLCSGGGLSGSCSFSDYGDYYDAMGSSSYVGHFNASQKTLLGWMTGRTLDLTAGGTTTLVPMANDSTAPHAVVIKVTGSTRTYWLEYRQPLTMTRA